MTKYRLKTLHVKGNNSGRVDELFIPPKVENVRLARFQIGSKFALPVGPKYISIEHLWLNDRLDINIFKRIIKDVMKAISKFKFTIFGLLLFSIFL